MDYLSYFSEQPELIKIEKSEMMRIPAGKVITVKSGLLIYYIYEAQMELFIDENIVKIQKGQAFAARKGKRYVNLSEYKSGGYAISFSDIHINPDFKHQHIGEKGWFIADLAEEGNLFAYLCEQILSEGRQGSEKILRYLVESLLVILLKSAQPEGGQLPEFIGSVKRYIENHYTEEITLAGLAQFANVSIYHLSHTFKAEMGISPIQYAINCRMEEAKKMLENSTVSVYEIAVRLGYENPNYFNLLFKKTVGMSPGRYRKENKNV